jgi:hypothetical protein
MPIDYKDYPDNWKEITKEIRIRANNKCELCFAPNSTIVLRDKTTGKWDLFRFNYSKEIYKKVKIILTTHHIDCNKKNNHPLNLLALCQRCHLRLDLLKHINNRRKNNENKRRRLVRNTKSN